MKTTRVYKPCGLCQGRGSSQQFEGVKDWTQPVPPEAKLVTYQCDRCNGSGKGDLIAIHETSEPRDLFDGFGRMLREETPPIAPKFP